MSESNAASPAAPTASAPEGQGVVVPFGRRIDARDAPVVLVGNPNVGKSLLFRNLTNHYVTVANYPGTTVEVVQARGVDAAGTGLLDFIDTPGINDLTPRADDARVTRGLLARHSSAIVLQVADAKNLRRALLLTLQLAELGHPMALVLNMLDELEERGGHIDVEKLSDLLGIPVVTAVALRGQGTAEVRQAIESAARPTLEPLAPEAPTEEYERNRLRLARVHEMMTQVYSIAQPRGASLGVRLGFWSMHPIKGVAMLAAVLAAVFWFVGLFGAGTLVDLFEVGLFQQRVQPAAIRLADTLLPFPHQHRIEMVPLEVHLPVTPIHEVELVGTSRSTLHTEYALTGERPLTALESVARFVHDFLVGDLGAVTMALAYALAIVLPIVATFFLAFSLLEDSGYLPRLSIMLNRIFRFMGLNGKAVLPMILGLGCATMATMTTRILETRKERVVTTILLALAIPCSAQLGVLMAMMASVSAAAALSWLGLVAAIILMVGWLSARLFEGKASDFVLEVPPLRRPRIGNVLTKTASRVEWYLKEVIPLFVLGTALLFLLDRLRLLGRIARWAEPVVDGWLGLPAEVANAFLVGFLRRDFGAVYLLDAASGPAPLLTPHQILVAMVTITLFMPCFANFLMIAREHGARTALRIIAFIFPFAFLVGGLVHRVGTWVASL
jgi:ferrous iron transport protein B